MRIDPLAAQGLNIMYNYFQPRPQPQQRQINPNPISTTVPIRTYAQTQIQFTHGAMSLNAPPVHTVARHDKLQYKNLQTNTTQGDVLPLPKSSEVTRLYFKNPNGLQLEDSKPNSFYSACTYLQEIGCDYAGFSEHNLATQKYSVRQSLHQTARRAFGSNYKMTMGSTSIDSENTFKPGGTMALVMGNICSSVISQGSDYMGRWSFFKFTGKRGKVLTVINAYQPCQASVKDAGPFTVVA